MNWLGEQLLGYGRIFRPGEAKQRLREVTAGEIRALARDFFHPERLNLALVSPLNTTNRLASTSRPNGPSPCSFIWLRAKTNAKPQAPSNHAPNSNSNLRFSGPVSQQTNTRQVPNP
jgi:hypothetical protein